MPIARDLYCICAMSDCNFSIVFYIWFLQGSNFLSERKWKTGIIYRVILGYSLFIVILNYIYYYITGKTKLLAQM